MTRPTRPRVLQEGSVKAGFAVIQPWLDEPFHLVDDVPAPQGRVVLHRLHPGNQGVVDVGLELAGVGDQTL